MIKELSSYIEKLIKRSGPGIEVKFDRPDEKFESKVSTGTINAFLYDVREDTQLRSNERVTRRVDGIVSEVPPPFIVTCSYLITAWSKADDPQTLDEQDLLSRVMRYVASQHEIPGDLFPGTANSGPQYPVPLEIGSLGEGGSSSEFWTSIGSKIRPSFVLSATIDLEPPFEVPRPAAATTSVELRVGEIDERLPRGFRTAAPEGREPRYTIGGRVTSARSGEPCRSVPVRLEELGRETRTDEHGFYVFHDVPGSGDQNLTLVFDQDVNSKTVRVPRASNSDPHYDFTL